MAGFPNGMNAIKSGPTEPNLPEKSIMHPDYPSGLLVGPSRLNAGNKEISEVDRDNLKSLYPDPYEVCLFPVSHRDMGYGKGDDPVYYSKMPFKWYDTITTDNVLSTMQLIDVDKNTGPFMANIRITDVKPYKGFNVEVGSNRKDARIYNLQGQAFAAVQTQTHIETGQQKFDGHGTFKINFKKEFRSNPVVVAFFSGFQAASGTFVRLSLEASQISTTGFLLSCKTWAGE